MLVDYCGIFTPLDQWLPHSYGGRDANQWFVEYPVQDFVSNYKTPRRVLYQGNQQKVEHSELKSLGLLSRMELRHDMSYVGTPLGSLSPAGEQEFRYGFTSVDTQASDRAAYESAACSVRSELRRSCRPTLHFYSGNSSCDCSG